MVDQNGSVIHLMSPVNVTRISIAGIVDRVFKLKVSFVSINQLVSLVELELLSFIPFNSIN